MSALINMFATPNLPATVLLLLVLLYWLVAAFGALDMDFLDMDFDLDTGSNVSGPEGIEGGVSLFSSVLIFFYIGKVPVMFLVSAFAWIFWLGTMITNLYVNPELKVDQALWVIPVVSIGSLLMTKVVFWPLTGIFDRWIAKEKDQRNRLVGLMGMVTSSEVTEKFGQVTIEQNGPPIVLNVYCGEMDRFKKGDVVTLVEYNADKNTYRIAPFAEKK